MGKADRKLMDKLRRGSVNLSGIGVESSGTAVLVQH